MHKLSLSLALILLLTACGGTSEPTLLDIPEPPVPSETPKASLIPSPSPTPSEAPEEIQSVFPIIDGSTSTITLHAALRWALTKEWVDRPDHSQTYGALERLIPGNENPADVVLAVKYYDETLQDARDRGAELVITPIAKEGFVFIVKKDNPIESLTQQQLRDIFSGKITNWNEVGGSDGEIIPVLRNHDSGSQTAMHDFMGGVPLTEDDDALYAGFMADMLSVTAENPNAIGYNILSWAFAQDLEHYGLRPLAVDGVTPSNETLSDDSYPLQVYTYSYYNEGNEKGKELTDWLMSDEGQKLVAEAGYVGLNGDLPPDGERLFLDSDSSFDVAHTYFLSTSELAPHRSFERIDDPVLLAALAGGKEKDVTAGWVFLTSYDRMLPYKAYYIIVTRAQGGLFEVIAEGDSAPRQ